MRDQKWISAGWLQLQRCHCARPSQQERLFGAVGQCCLCVKKWNKSQCDKFGMHRCANDDTTAIHPSCCDPAWPLCCLSQSKKFQNFQNHWHQLPCFQAEHLCRELQSVSTESAPWFISRHTGMQQWRCFVVSSHCVFRHSSKMTEWLQSLLLRVFRNLMTCRCRVFLPLIFKMWISNFTFVWKLPAQRGCSLLFLGQGGYRAALVRSTWTNNSSVTSLTSHLRPPQNSGVTLRLTAAPVATNKATRPLRLHNTG